MAPADMTTLTPSSKHPENSVANMLRDQIESGNYKTGDWLPTERTLAEDLHVDRRTIRMAINQLVRSGLVIRQPHCRPIVGPLERKPSERAASEAASSSLSSFMALLMWHGGSQIEREITPQQRIFWGMNQALAAVGYHATFVDLGAVSIIEEENAAREAEQLRYILDRGFGGAVFYPYAYRSNRGLVEEVRRAIPLVTIDRRIDSADTDFVGTDNYGAMRATIDHLISRGHRRIAYVTKNEQIRAVQERIQGYIDAIHEADLHEMVLSIPSRDQAQAWTSVDMMFQLPKGERPTAAAVFNDYAAVDLMNRLKTMGLSVPGDVAITGFDDIVPRLPSGVGLTTVAQPFEEIGRKAVDVLLRRLKAPSAPTMSAELEAQLTIRESSEFHGDDQP